MKNHAGLDYRFEPKLLHFDAISAGREIGDIIRSSFIGEALVMNPRAGVNDRNCGCRDHCLFGVGDPAGERCIGGLSMKRGKKEQTEQHY